jgi:hypothetical protein
MPAHKVYNITADDFWRYRAESLNTMARRFRCSKHTACYTSQGLGFRRHRQGGVSHAPCADCGKSTEVAGLDERRICDNCAGRRTVNGVNVRLEFRAFLDRQARRGIFYTPSRN